ncbi:hypothetical protein [Alicyclobacillus sp.]|uniref:hypothetical protein n=1 Tax=Alicyclobacillus sp. TaxID=61169 RepID=UPI0025C6F5E7|nr:hypothetical protein [Alicyclobacillus sp.]MCL6515702.1 hypothetical protein [Alicyclobacillus sp.]
MNDFDEELKQRLRALPELPFTPELADQIRREARRASSRRSSSRRRGSTWLVGASGVGVAAAMAWLVWAGIDADHRALPKPNQTLSASASRAVSPADVGLSTAPISVGFIGVTGSGAGPRDTVTATLTNVGTVPLGQEDVFGVLSFQSDADKDLLGATRWVTLVDAPAQPIQPGQTVTWTFRPVGAPADAQGNLTLSPRLVFFKKGLAPAAQADVVWRTPRLATGRIAVEPTSQWPNGEAFTVRVHVSNVGSTPVRLHDLLAILWFTEPGASEDWTDHRATRFMAQVDPDPASARLLGPGQETDVVFRLIGPPVDYALLSPHVQWILR